ncbi:MAG: hypothetical protein GF333_02380 [Candidatus Omnitrophica bacterium]|nr:hypothetical protein [Candidatus Omnitrophota bacterium]
MVFSAAVMLHAASGILLPAQTQEIPRRVLVQKKEFLAGQISAGDQQFLNAFTAALDDLEKVNELTFAIYSPVIGEKRGEQKELVPEVAAAAAYAAKRSAKNRAEFDSLARFLNSLDQENSEELRAQLRELKLDYQTIAQNSSQLSPDLEGEGSAYYFHVYMEKFENSFGMPLDEFTRRCGARYAEMKRLIREHRIGQLKAALANQKDLFLRAKETLRREVSENLPLAYRTWYISLINSLTDMQLAQYEVDERLCELLAARTRQIPVPRQPQLPDFGVLSLRMAEKKDLDRGATFILEAVVANFGDLAVPSSRVLIEGPDGFKKAKLIPGLEGKETHTLTWRYRTVSPGTIPFTITANYRQTAWEENPDNNVLTRKIILLP